MDGIMGSRLKTMFGNIAPKYDFMNNLLSFYIHRRWKRKAASLACLRTNAMVLDCAAGTGDLSVEFKKFAKDGYVIATDFCADMLELAEKKFKRLNMDISCSLQDAMQLSYEDNTFDAAGMAFGIRNVDDPLKCLKELARTVKPGGRVIILEFGSPEGVFSYPYKLYSRVFIPFLGRIFTGSGDAYYYLQDSASKFPYGKDFIAIMRQAGVFDDISSVRLNLGIAFIYIGIKGDFH